MSYSAVRKRRRQRLSIIGGVVFVVAGLIAVQYVRVQNRPPAPAPEANSAQREEGLTAFAAGDNVIAIEKLTAYVEDNPGNAEALHTLATAHRRLGHVDPKRLVSAVNYYRAALEADTQRLETVRELLSLLIESPSGVEQEILRLADRLVRADAQDKTALRGRVVAQRRLQRTDDAIDAARAFLDVYPVDVAMHRRLLDLLDEQRNPPEVLLRHTEDFRNAYPGDAAPMLVEAYARLLVDDREAALGWLARAEAATPPDAAFVAEKVAVMDRAEGPKSFVLARLGDRPGAVGFVAVGETSEGPVGMIHALETPPRQRRKGAGRLLMAGGPRH
ncbi:MAG: hypothetical protein AAGL98_07000, partial [Planctomycetota bacterium]